MALNWQHIKGVYGTTPVYTYLVFSSTQGTTYASNPKLYSLSVNQHTIPTTGDLGYILTSKATGQTIEQDLTLIQGKKLQFGSNSSIKTYLDNEEIEHLTINGVALELLGSASINFDSPKSVFKKTVKMEDQLSLTKATSSTASANANLSIPEGTAYIGKGLYVNDKCEAVYFNSLSDIRAKTNLTAFNENALDIIKKVQTYTFEYKNNPGKLSYGVIAQDLQDVSINGFSFVDNAAATGLDDDYMSVHESKLVYLLIEGMKEQQKEIEALRKELEELKNGK